MGVRKTTAPESADGPVRWYPPADRRDEPAEEAARPVSNWSSNAARAIDAAAANLAAAVDKAQVIRQEVETAKRRVDDFTLRLQDAEMAVKKARVALAEAAGIDLDNEGVA